MVCVEVGQAHWAGSDVEKDEEEAIRLFRRACKGESAIGCFHVARALEAKRTNDLEPKEILSLYQQSVSGGFQLACKELERLRN